MELLSEMRTPAQALSYAVAQERGQQNQRDPKRKQLQLEHNSSTFISTKNKTSNTTHPTIKTMPTLLEMQNRTRHRKSHNQRNRYETTSTRGQTKAHHGTRQQRRTSNRNPITGKKLYFRH